MKPIARPLIPLILVTGCSPTQTAAPTAAAPTVTPTPTPPPSPTPTPTPSPTPTPTPTPAPTPTPTPTPTPSPTGSASYIRFAEIYVTRLGAGITLPSACSGLELRGTPPAVLPASNFGQGLAYRFVLTPQVWSVTGDGLSLAFDSRTVDATDTSAEVSHATTLAGDRIRFSVTLPVAGGAGLDYARLAQVIAPLAGVERRYQCVIGISTLASDLPTTAFAYGRTALLGAAQIGGADYTLERSSVSFSADFAQRRITISLQLTATPRGGGAPIDLGSYSASGAIDPANGNFNVALSGGALPVTGAISGRFFGPQAIELAAAFGGRAAPSGTNPGFAFAGGAVGAR